MFQLKFDIQQVLRILRHRDFGSYFVQKDKTTGNFVVTQGKYFDCVYWHKRHVSF